MNETSLHRFWANLSTAIAGCAVVSLVFAVCLAVAPLRQSTKSAVVSIDDLRGTWVEVARENEGSIRRVRKSNSYSYTFDVDSRFEVCAVRGEIVPVTYRYRHDAAETPTALDIIHARKNETRYSNGIINRGGEYLIWNKRRVRGNQQESTRPCRFTPNASDSCHIIVLRRVSDDDFRAYTYDSVPDSYFELPEDFEESLSGLGVSNP